MASTLKKNRNTQSVPIYHHHGSPLFPISSSICLLIPCLLLQMITYTAAFAAFNLDTKVRVGTFMSTPVTLPPNAAANNVNLDKYMVLPVEQYALVPMPLNATLSRLQKNSDSTSNDDMFELRVPPLHFLWLEVQPIVEATVTLEEDRVIIASEKCILKSNSSYIERVKLNERFDFRANAVLTWMDSSSSSSNNNGETFANGTNNDNNEEEEVSSSLSSSSFIAANTEISVNVDTPMPFRAIPKKAIEKIGNTAMRISMNYVLKSFMKGLAQDYIRWAEDEDYRNFRSELAAKEEEEEEEIVAFVTAEQL